MRPLHWSRWLLFAATVLAPTSALAGPDPTGTPAGTPAEPSAGSAPMSQAEGLPPITPHDTCKKQPMGERFRITLERESGLVELVRWMSSISCTKFVWGANVRDGKVTVVSPEPVTIQQAYAAFYAALETMGLTVEQSGDYLKVVESKDATRHVLPVYGTDQAAPPRDRYVTQLYRPRPGRVGDVVAVVEHLKGERATVQAVGDLVIVTDTGSSIARMMKVIEEVDQPDPSEQDAITLHPLQHADPAELAEIVREVFMSGASGAARPAGPTRSTTTGSGKAKAKGAATSSPSAAADPASEARVTAVAVDERTRTLVITAPREDFVVVRRLIDRLDVAVPDDGGTLFVLPLRHADPEDVAAVLGSLPASKDGGQGQAKGSARADAGPEGRPSVGSAGTGVSIGGQIHVTADPATRSLVVMASHRDFLALKRVVESLDRERRQVYIEAYILELSTVNSVGAGVSGHYGRDVADGGLGFVSSQTGDASSMVLDTSLLSGLAAGVLGPAIPSGLGQDIPSFGVMIQALETRDDVNIVADPHLYTADNKTAKMEVGENVPIPVGTSQFSGVGGPVTQTNYDRQDVSLALEVTPHIGDSDALTLDISIENHEIASESEERGPTTTTRMLELEEVLARDGQPVVLGGLVQEKETVETRQIPGLGSIPLLGWLFKNRRRTKRKVNLLIVLIPHVLDSPDDARRIHQRRIRERREFLERETAFERRDLPAHINYARKSGLLSAVNAEAGTMQAELRFEQQADAELQRSVAHTIAPEGSYEVTAAPPAGTVAAGPPAP